ncbi:MAG: hypothetical protein ACM3KM_02180 [Acidobacteriaceae bacterium]
MATCQRTQDQIRFFFKMLPVEPFQGKLPKGTDKIAEKIEAHVYCSDREDGIRCKSCHEVYERTKAQVWGSA